MKLVIPHIHKTLGGTGFFSRISEKGEIKELRVTVLEGLRQIEGILIGRRVFETPLVISRICGICPTSHILNACRGLENALGIKVSSQTERLRRLITSAQIIQSHTAHLFFMSLADFFDIEGEGELIKKFSKESQAVLDLRDFGLKVISAVGGRTVHPMTPKPGGFTKLPDKKALSNVLKDYDKAYQAGLILVNLFQGLEYPQLKRETKLASSYDEKGYPHHLGRKIKIGDELFSPEDFFFNQVEEDLKTPPTKKVKYKGEAYMVGAIARIKNNSQNLDQEVQSLIKEFYQKQGIKEKDFFSNNFYNSYCQAVEVLHFIKEIKKEILALEKEPDQEPYLKFQLKPGKGLGLLEAPRGILLSYFEIGKDGRIADCSIITPTAQYLSNLEEDLKVLLPNIKDLSKDKKIRRIKTLIRAYDPCIACAVH
jgi:coenzyme F420-reducing hydrogenase alpha subunit